MKLFGNIKKKSKFNSAVNILFFPISIFYMEMILISHCNDNIRPTSILYIAMFSLVIGLVCLFFASMFRKKGKYAFSIILMIILVVIFGIQLVYFTIFKMFTSIYSVMNAGDALADFWKEALVGIWKSIVPLLFLFVPLIVLIVCGNRFIPDEDMKLRWFAWLFVIIAAVQITCVQLIKANTTGIMSYEYVYSEIFSPILSVQRFGVLTTFRIDVQNFLLDKLGLFEEADNLSPSDTNNNIPDVSASPSSTADDTEATEEPVTYEMSVLDIDFDDLIASESDSTIVDMHEYFSSLTGTSQNEYTGMFEGYNLIWICAEGFSSFALDETHTPTLCKLANEGFVFNNFYNPVWGVSTSDGEYVTMTGLIPKSGVWSFSKSSDNYMPFGFGTMFSNLGYTARAYHDHTYTYYDRDLSHPNMGYIYKGVGNGLDVKKTWPESDVEMMEKTIPEYIADPAFHVYYMTVSGHLNYTFLGNSMADRHKSDVSDLPYSEPARAYIACQMEFDQAVKYLIDQLDEAGVLDKTVIVISGDHYPYGLTIDEMEEIAGGNIEENFELYRSTLIIWNSEMETVEVDKYCSSLDIMPTLSNLFGLDYDSRLVMGFDILSDSPGLVIFSNRSFITEYGRYNSTTDTFTEVEGADVPDGYITDILSVVNDKFTYSALILDEDYYAKVLE